MGAWTYKNDGKRGFCTDGNGRYGGPVTLTSYIWEYLGNPCPPEICGNGASATTRAPLTSSMAMDVRMNRFSSTAAISFKAGTSYATPVHLSIYNATGRLVATLINQKMSSGRHGVMWKATDHPSGLYLVRLNADGAVRQKKIMLLN